MRAFYGCVSGILGMLGSVSLIAGVDDTTAVFAAALLFAVWELNETIKRRPNE